MTVVALGVGGLALAVALSLGAFALAGHSLGEPASGVLVPVTSPSRIVSDTHGSHTQTPSASPSPSPTTAPSGGGGSPSPGDDHGSGGHGSDD